LDNFILGRYACGRVTEGKVMAEGYIYILFNRAFQYDQYKIGMTTKKPEDRAREISNGTGVPRAFEVLYEQKVVDCQRAERLLHQKLHKYRSTGNREFFQIPIKTAIKAAEDVADEVGRVDEQTKEATPVPVAEGGAGEVPRPFGEISATPSPPRKQSSRNGGIVTFEDHLAYTDAPRQPILRELRRRVLTLDDRLQRAEQCTPGNRIAYKIPGNKIFLEVKVQRAAIVLHLAAGGCPDPNGIADDIPESHGWRQLKKRITILSVADLDVAMPFIEAAYRTERR
jgi:predicted transport protein